MHDNNYLYYFNKFLTTLKNVETTRIFFGNLHWLHEFLF